MDNKQLPILCSDKDCTGCMACVNACNKNALIPYVNEEGFYRPLLDAEQCIMCHLCEKSCPVLNRPVRFAKEDIKVFAAWHIDEHIRRNSSSGGAFSALAESVLENNGVVVGATYTDDMHIEHIVITDKQDLPKLRLSKYAQSKIGTTLTFVKDYLQKGRQVLFVGTPCQAAGLKGFLKKDYENLTIVDLICHGVPSNNLLQSYLKWLEPKTGNITSINFRDKQKGWYDNLRVVKTSDGKEKTMKGKDDAYWIAFNRNNCLQESCYECKAQGFPRCSDITLADFWRIGQQIPFGYKNEIEKGISMIIVNNPRAQKILQAASKYLFLEERTIGESITGNQAGVKSSIRPTSRDSFYNDLKELSFDQFRLRYMKPSSKEFLVKVFRERLPFAIIKHIRLKKQK